MQIPSQLLVWDSLPRNAMGKVGPRIQCAPFLFERMVAEKGSFEVLFSVF